MGNIKSELKKLTEGEVNYFVKKGNFPNGLFLNPGGEVFCELIEYLNHFKN